MQDKACPLSGTRIALLRANELPSGLPPGAAHGPGLGRRAARNDARGTIGPVRPGRRRFDPLRDVFRGDPFGGAAAKGLSSSHLRSPILFLLKDGRLARGEAKRLPAP